MTTGSPKETSDLTNQANSELTTPSGPLPGFVAALRVAVVAGVFTLVVTALLVWNYVTHLAKDPLDSPQYLALQKQLAADPQNEQLKEAIRELDLRLRQEYFRARTFNRWGTLLLIAGLITFAIFAKIASTLRRPLPHPSATEVWDEAFERATRRRLVAVAGFVVLLIVAVAILAWRARGTVHQALALRGAVPHQPGGELAQGSGPQKESSPEAAATGQDKQSEKSGTVQPAVSTGAPVGNDAAPTEEFARFWPRFRGPNGDGISTHPDPPVEWNAEEGRGILWKTPIDLPGHNSPVVWDKFVFVTGAIEDRRVCYALDADSGKVLWQRDIPPTPESRGKKPKVMKDTGFAAPTAATDGRRVYAVFANGDVAALDFQGNILWVKGLGIPDNAYGHASSLCTYRNWVIVLFDQGEPDDDKSKLFALEGPTGRVVWQVTRPTGNSWTSPLIANLAGKAQLITVANPFVISYNPEDGTEWWRFDGTTGDCGPSPTVHGDLVIAGGEYSYYMYAIRGDGSGDVTKTHKVWEAEDALPDTCSPLAFDHYALWISSTSVLACYNVNTGEKLWEHEFPDNTFASSPSYAGGKVYLFSKEGACWVGTVTDQEFKIEHENSLGEGCVTSPAFQPGRLYIRGEKHVFCIGH
ncbi:PQQ-binding-like beta-propeller repeat protein [Thermogutta sp.]|uniref:PQQ-binding-like beta-propeller repeat protein n=1 Tax=Thermogutta sp. TaxID=1962930 RepID=UPI00321FBD6B